MKSKISGSTVGFGFLKFEDQEWSFVFQFFDGAIQPGWFELLKSGHWLNQLPELGEYSLFQR
ncbi:MAG: hypothetical protein Q8T04_17120, partial [Bacteroidota bacterium]|nr:hypothetical protein [Bacteroidota bacterium]